MKWSNDPCDDMPVHTAKKWAGLLPCGCRIGRCRCNAWEYSSTDYAQRSLLTREPPVDRGRMIERCPGAE